MREYKIHPPNGIPTTVQLPDDEAKRLGLLTDEPVATKIRTPKNKAAPRRAEAPKGE